MRLKQNALQRNNCISKMTPSLIAPLENQESVVSVCNQLSSHVIIASIHKYNVVCFTTATSL